MRHNSCHHSGILMKYWPFWCNIDHKFKNIDHLSKMVTYWPMVNNIDPVAALHKVWWVLPCLTPCWSSRQVWWVTDSACLPPESVSRFAACQVWEESRSAQESLESKCCSSFRGHTHLPWTENSINFFRLNSSVAQHGVAENKLPT